MGDPLTLAILAIGAVPAFYLLTWLRTVHLLLRLRARSTRLARLGAEVAALRQQREFAARLLDELRTGSAVPAQLPVPVPITFVYGSLGAGR